MKINFINNLNFLLTLSGFLALYSFCFIVSTQKVYITRRVKNTVLFFWDIFIFLIYDQFTLILKDLSGEDLFCFGVVGTFFVLGTIFVFFKSKKIAALGVKKINTYKCMKINFLNNLNFLLPISVFLALYSFCFIVSTQKVYITRRVKNTVLFFWDISIFLIYDQFISILKDLSGEDLFCFGVVGTFFILGNIFIFFKSKNIAALDSLCLKIQKFCFENQLLIFSTVMFLIFLVSLLEMTFIGSIVGLACLFNGMRFFHFLHEENILYLETLIFAVVCYRYVTNPSGLNYVLCIIFLWYLWSIVSIVLPVPNAEETFKKFREQLQPSVLHMQTEFYLFYILERVVFFYLAIRFSLGGVSLCCALGSDLHVILSYYMYASFVACVLAKLLTALAFNPLTEKQAQVGLFCVSCGSLMFMGSIYNVDIHAKATAGGSTTPPPGFLTNYHQRNAFLCTAVRAQEVDAAKFYVAVYNIKPPVIPGTDRISLDDTLRVLEEDTSPEVKKRISRYRGTNFDLKSPTEDQITSAVRKGIQAHQKSLHGGSKEAGSTQEGEVIKAIKDAIGEQEGGTGAATTNTPEGQDKKMFVKRGVGRWEAEEKASAVVKKSFVVDPACNSAGVQKDQNFANKNWKKDMVSEAMKDFKPPKGDSGSTTP